MTKRTGTTYERELRHLLEAHPDIVVVRSAGSMGWCDLVVLLHTYDIIGKQPTLWFPHIIEVKSTKKDVFYSSSDSDQFEKLAELARRGINCHYFVRFVGGKGPGWAMVRVPSYRAKNFKVERDQAVPMDEIVGKFIGENNQV